MSDYKELVEALRWCSVDEYVPCTGCPMDEETHGTGCFNIMHQRAAAAIEELEASVEWLKDANDELREAQTYIDHYGDKWRTSAKDVPTSAYNHGYMDGKNEAEQALEPKQLRCRECKYWSEPVDEVDGKLYGQCERPITAIKRTSLVSETWYCADAERKGA